jgi:hypothetical protein
MSNGAPPHYPPLPPPAHAKPVLGLMRNRANQDPAGAAFAQNGYTLAIVEFDDQGVCYDRRQMQAMAAALETMRGQNPVIIVFTHGWRHDGRSDDDNLINFCRILHQAAIDAPHRPVFGVFAAWRGLSWCGGPWGVIELPTFWGRKEAALRVALGSIREMLGRLRAFRQSERDAGRAPLLIIIGHSFGGLIVYSAVAQSLIEAATTEGGHIVPSFADLVLLVNPAFEGARYLPIFEQINNRHNFDPDQPPVFVSVTAYNDWATGLTFPIAMLIPSFRESARNWRQRQAILCTMGHIGWMRTHEVDAPAALTRANSQPRFTPGDRAGPRPRVALSPAAQNIIHFPEGAELRTLPGRDQHNPFWVVGATKVVVDGHDGIFGNVFVNFVYDLVVAHMSTPRQLAGGVPDHAGPA